MKLLRKEYKSHIIEEYVDGVVNKKTESKTTTHYFEPNFKLLTIAVGEVQTVLYRLEKKNYKETQLEWGLSKNGRFGLYQNIKRLGLNGETFMKIEGFSFDDLEYMYETYLREKKLNRILK